MSKLIRVFSILLILAAQLILGGCNANKQEDGVAPTIYSQDAGITAAEVAGTSIAPIVH